MMTRVFLLLFMLIVPLGLWAQEEPTPAPTLPTVEPFAVGANALLNNGLSASCGNGTATASFNTTANAIILACIGTENSSAAEQPTLTSSGLTWVNIGTRINAGTTYRLSLYRAMSASATTGTTVTLGLAATQQNCTWAIGELTGVDTSGTNGSGAIVGSAVTGESGSPLTLTLPTFSSTTNAGYGCIGSGGSGITIGVGTGFTQIGTQTGCCGSRTFHEWAVNDNTVDATVTSGNILGIAIEVKEGVAVPAPTFDDTQILGSLRDFFTWLFTPRAAHAQEDPSRPVEGPPTHPFPPDPPPPEPGPTPRIAQTYYLDANLTADCTTGNYSAANRNCTGSDGSAYNDLQDVCTVIGGRVVGGTKGDDLTIRGGTYRRGGVDVNGGPTYDCLLNGTSGDHTVVTAKTCAAGAAGCVKRKDGNWYENVVFDDFRRLTETAWSTTGTSNVYKIVVPFAGSGAAPVISGANQSGTCRAGACATQSGRAVTDTGTGCTANCNYGFTSVDIGPYRILVDGQPSQFYDYDYPLSETANTARLPAGTHTYNKNTHTLYMHLLGNRNPITSPPLIETWGAYHSWLRPRLEYVDIKGIELRGWGRIWTHATWDDARYMKNLTLQGNQFTDNLTSISDPKGSEFLDFNAVGSTICPLNKCPHYADQHDIDILNNIFIRQAGESFQYYGDDNQFQRNWVIDSHSQWSGGHEAYPAVNFRNQHRAIIKFNWFLGHGNSTRNAQNFINETDNGHNDGTGTCRYNTQEFSYNLVEGMTRVGEFILGSPSDNNGPCAMTGVKFDNNILLNFNNSTETWRFLSPMKTSEMKNNLFYSNAGGAPVLNASTDAREDFTPAANTFTIADNIFMNLDNVSSSRFCSASGVTINRNMYSGNSSNGSCTGSNVNSSAPTFVSITDRDFRPASAGAAQVTGGNLGPYTWAVTPPAGSEWWDAENDLAPRIATVRVVEGFPNQVLVDFKLGLPRFSFGPILPVSGSTCTATGLTVKKEGVANPVTACAKQSDTQWKLTVTNNFVCNDTGASDVTVSYDPSVGNITDSALPTELRQELVEETDFAGSNLITSGCGGGGTLTPVFTLSHMRWKGWDGPVDSTDWLDLEDTDIRVFPGGKQRLRVQVVNSVAAGTMTPGLQCNSAGGTFYDVTEDCSGDGTASAPFCFVTTPGVTGQPDTMSQLTSCGGTYVSGKFIQSDIASPAVTTALNGCFEAEYALQLKENVAVTQTPIKCQLTNGAGQVLPFGGSFTGAMSWGHRTTTRSHYSNGSTMAGGGSTQ